VNTQISADALRQLAAGRPRRFLAFSLEEEDVKDAGLVSTTLFETKAS